MRVRWWLVKSVGLSRIFATTAALVPVPNGSSVYDSKGYTTFDLRLTARLPDVGLARGTELSLQINDLFDARPPFFPAADGIGGSYNPIGRYAAMSLRKAF